MPDGEGDATELLDELAELGPDGEGEGDAGEDLDLNESNDWEFVP
jgi:hypothetical protein